MSCNIGPAEREILRNMDRSRMSGIGKLQDDAVTCHVINHYKLQEGCVNDPKQSTTRAEQ